MPHIRGSGKEEKDQAWPGWSCPWTYLPKFKHLGCVFLLLPSLVSSSSAQTLIFEVMFLTHSSVAELSPEDEDALPWSQLPKARLGWTRREEQLHNPGIRPGSGYNLLPAVSKARVLAGRTAPPELQLPKILHPSHFQALHRFSQGLNHVRCSRCIGPGSEPQCCSADERHVLAAVIALLRFLGLAKLLENASMQA